MVAETVLLKGTIQISLVVLLISILLVLIRLLRGPDPADRIVALDLISFLIVAFIVAYSMYSGTGAFLDVAIAYALIAFLGTVALARFRERLARKNGRAIKNREE